MNEKTYYKTTVESAIGKITLGSDGKSLVGLWTDGQKYFGDTVPNKMLPNDNLNVFTITKDWLNRYFDGKKPRISELPLAPIGGEFRQTVWKMLTEIPYGEVVTYGELAQKIARQRGIERMSAQAVGGAVGHNPIAIIILKPTGPKPAASTRTCPPSWWSVTAHPWRKSPTATA